MQCFWHIFQCIVGLQKKITTVAQQRGCETLGMWKSSIVNHMYWVASDTPSGDGELMWAKWESLLCHIQDLHDGHPNPLYTRCQHGPLEDREYLEPCKCYILYNIIRFSMRFTLYASGTSYYPMVWIHMCALIRFWSHDQAGADVPVPPDEERCATTLSNTSNLTTGSVP